MLSEEERPYTQETSEERSAGRSYIPSHIGTDIDDCPDNPKKDADANRLLQVKAICVDKAGEAEASYLSRFIGVVLFKVWKVFANNKADVVKEPGKEGGLYCPYISINGKFTILFLFNTGGTIGFSRMSMRRTFQSRQPTRGHCRS